MDFSHLIKMNLFVLSDSSPELIADRSQNWGKAHRTLMPAFGPLAIRKMFQSMMDVASQMILRWDRLGPDNEIDPSDDFTICYTYSEIMIF